jgi:sugar phosphate isomerase/epimerase
MQKLFSTYIFLSRKLTRELLGQIANSSFDGLEIFCSRSHFDYANKSEVQEMGRALADNRLKLASLHAPTSRDLSATREGGQPLSICEVERVRRIEAMDELKRALDVAEEIPFSRAVFHMGGPRETADPRKRDAAFSSLEHLILHARHRGVTICVENTTSEMGAPSYLRSFVDETRLAGLRFNFDIGHAHLAEGAEENRIADSFGPLRELVAGVHVHDNHAERDEHLPPYEGTIDWIAAVKLLKTAPEGNLPLTLEIKENNGPNAPSTLEQLAAARKSMDRLGEEWG